MSNPQLSMRIDESIWGVQNILDTDHEMIEFELNFPSHVQVDNYLADELNVYSSSMNFSPVENEMLSQDEDLEDDDDVLEGGNSFEDRDSYRDANQDGVYYLI